MNNSDIVKTFQPFIQQMRPIPNEGISRKNNDFNIQNNSVKPFNNKEENKLLPTDPLNKIKVNIIQATQLPGYAYRGLKGDPDSNFHEFLSLGKVAYYTGGPVLLAMFAAGINPISPVSLANAKGKVKVVGVGIALYYIAIALKNVTVDLPIKLLRGIDLNQKAEVVVPTKIKGAKDNSPPKIEYRDAFISPDWARFDLMYRDDDKAMKNPRLINERFDKIARKMGMSEDLVDSDNATIPSIKKIIIQSRAWKYALAVPAAILALGLSSQKNSKTATYIWETIGNNLKQDLKKIFSPKSGNSLRGRLTLAKYVLKDNLFNPLKDSCIEFWKGSGEGLCKHFGKATILGTLGLILLANASILYSSYAGRKKIIDISAYSLRARNMFSPEKNDR